MDSIWFASGIIGRSKRVLPSLVCPFSSRANIKSIGRDAEWNFRSVIPLYTRTTHFSESELNIWKTRDIVFPCDVKSTYKWNLKKKEKRKLHFALCLTRLVCQNLIRASDVDNICYSASVIFFISCPKINHIYISGPYLFYFTILQAVLFIVAVEQFFSLKRRKEASWNCYKHLLYTLIDRLISVSDESTLLQSRGIH